MRQRGKIFLSILFFLSSEEKFRQEHSSANRKLLGALMALLFVDVVESEEWAVCADQIRT